MHAGIQTTVRSTKKKQKNGLFVVTVSTPPACFLNETLDVTEFSHVDTQRKKKNVAARNQIVVEHKILHVCFFLEIQVKGKKNPACSLAARWRYGATSHTPEPQFA